MTVIQRPAPRLAPIARHQPSRELALKFTVRRAVSGAAIWIAKRCRRAVIRVQIACLTYRIESTQQYLAECAVDGLDMSLSVGEFLTRMSADIDLRAALRREL